MGFKLFFPTLLFSSIISVVNLILCQNPPHNIIVPTASLPSLSLPLLLVLSFKLKTDDRADDRELLRVTMWKLLWISRDTNYYICAREEPKL